MDLEPGWYWVKLFDGWQVGHVFTIDCTPDGERRIAFAGFEESSSMEELKRFAEKIGPRIPTPDEVAETAPALIIAPRGWDIEHLQCVRDIVRQELGK